MTGNTIKTYLKSIEIFGRFIERGEFYKPSLLTDLETTVLVQLQQRMQDYRKAVHRRTAGETTTRDVDESYSAMTPQDLKAFEESEIAKQAVTLIGQSLENHVLSSKEFTLVRDYLLVTMMVENGSRPGPLENAKVKRFEQATYTKSKARWTLIVDEHKTTRHQGPAELVMDNRLFGYMKIYVRYIRPAFVHSAAEEALFIKDDGKKFEKGTIGKRVDSVFKKAGVRNDIRVTSTRVRKIYSGAAFQLDPEKKRAVNFHMKHQQKTADRNYVIKVNASRSAEAHSIMRQIVRGNEAPKENQDDNTTEETPALNPSPSTEPASKMPESKPGKESESDDDMYDDSTLNLRNDDKVVLKTVYQQDISRGTKLSMQEFRHKMRADLYLRTFVTDATKVKKMYDFVRARGKKAAHLREIEVDEFDYDGIKSLPSSMSRKHWSPEDEKCIEERFSKHDKMPIRSSILTVFNQDPVLKYILDVEGADRCYEKVKNLFRKKVARPQTTEKKK